MKTIKHAILLTIALCAVSAQAAFYNLEVAAVNYNSSGSALNSPLGSLATFNFSLQKGAGSQDSYYDTKYSTFSLEYFSAGDWQAASFVTTPIISGLTANQQISSSVLNFTVSWTPGLLRDLGQYRIRTTISGDSSPGSRDGLASGSTYSYLNLEPAAVPEPTQAIAASMLLGCGGLVFARRRFIKKQAK